MTTDRELNTQLEKENQRLMEKISDLQIDLANLEREKSELENINKIQASDLEFVTKVLELKNFEKVKDLRSL